MKKILILLLIIFYTLIIFQGCSKDDFECSPENIEKIIAQTCNEYNKEACVREVIDILSFSCDINKTDLK